MPLYRIGSLVTLSDVVDVAEYLIYIIIFTKLSGTLRRQRRHVNVHDALVTFIASWRRGSKFIVGFI